MKTHAKPYRGLLLAGTLAIGTFLFAFAPYLSSPAYHFEKETGGTYLGEIRPEMQGVYAHKCVTPSDNYYSKQKQNSMSNIGDIESVWDSYTGAGVKIAVIDDGFDYTHPEYIRADGTSAISQDSAYFLASGNSFGRKLYKNDPTVIQEDWDSDHNEWATHGTNTSTTAAAPMNNGGGVGIAPEAEILALKVDMSFAAMEGAMYYAIEKGADIISMSLGAFAETFTDGFGDEQDWDPDIADLLEDAANSAYANGVIVIAAAGNEATYHKSYPACNSHVIGVGALEENEDRTLAAFTNYNQKNGTGEQNVDILAPGYVYTAGIEGSKSNSFSHVWHQTSGTSFSCPIVAGAAALWKEANPNGTPDQFLAELQDSAADQGYYANKYVPVNLYGSGYTKQGPSNISAGRLDVGALMALGSDVTGVALSPSKATLYSNYGSGLQLEATVKPATAEDKNVTWKSSNTSVATVSSTGYVTPKAPGSATITVTTVDGGFTATSAITVKQYVAPTAIHCGETSVSIEAGQSYTLNNVTFEPSDVSEPEFFLESSNESVVTVSEATNSITGVGVGAATITVSTINVLTDEIISDEFTVTVTQPTLTDVTIDFLTQAQITTNSEQTVVWTASPVTFTVDRNTNNQQKANAYPSNPLRAYTGFKLSIDVPSGYRITSASINCVNSYVISETWSNATSTVSGTKVTLTPSSNATSLSCVLTAQRRINSMTISFRADAPAPTVPVTGISVSPTSASINIGETKSLTATIAPSDATNKGVTWTSSNTNIATVSADGAVTGITKGTANITVKSNDGGFSAVSEITVNKVAPTGITLNKTKLDLNVGANETLVATIAPANATDKTVTWTSSDINVATVINGNVIGIASGKATITAKTVNNLTATCSVTVVTPEPVSGTATYTITSSSSVTSAGVPEGSSASFNNTYSTKDQLTSGNRMTLTLSGYDGLTISSITLSMHSNSSKGAGSLSVTAGSTSLASLEACGFNEWYDNSSFGSGYRDVHVELTDTSYIIESGETITIVIEATVNSLYCQSFTLEYDNGSTAGPSVTDISLPATSKTLDKGQEYQLTPTVTMSDGSAYTGTITYASTNTNVATVSETGLVRAINKGNADITATAGSKSATLSLTVTWSTEPKLDSITLANVPTTATYKGTFSTSGIVVTAHYTNGGEDKNVTSATTFTALDTDSIGYKEVTATYTEGTISKSAKFTVFVSNVGATRSESIVPGESKTGTVDAKAELFSADGQARSVDGVSWTLDIVSGVDSPYFGTDVSNGSQIGSSRNGVSEFTITSEEISETLTSVRVTARSGGATTLSVSVGGTAFTRNGNTSVSLTNSSTEYEFTGTGSGRIVLHYQSTANCASYFKGYQFTKQGGVVYSWTGHEQATSFVNYLKTFDGSCAADFASREEIKRVVGEYNAMIIDSKNDEVLMEEFLDKGGITTNAIVKLKMMVDQYNATLKEGETKLVLELPDESYDSSSSLRNGLSSQESRIATLSCIIGFGLAVSAGLWFLAKRRNRLN